MWSWTNWLAAKATESDKELLLLNLDETSVPMTFTHADGNVMLQDPIKNWTKAPRQRVARGLTRANFTHVGIICNDPAIQPRLPQVLFVSEKLLTATTFAAIQAQLPDNVYVKRLPKGWNNRHEHAIIIRLLGMILAPICCDRSQPLLMFDAAMIHLADEVMNELAAANIWFCLIPARLTWLLQPLDTHGFAKYKRHLKRSYQDTLLDSPQGNNAERMILLVVDTIRAVLQGNRWDNAFRRNGLAGNQTHVSTFIKRNLEFEILPPYPAMPPTPDVLRLCWPRNRTIRPHAVYPALPADEAFAEFAPLAILPAEHVAEALPLPGFLPALFAPPPEAASSSSAAPRAAHLVEDEDATSSLESIA